jgi:hypothetical protein
VFANVHPAGEIVDHAAKMLDQLAFLVENHPDKPLVKITAAALPARWQRRKRPDIAIEELPRNRMTRATPGVCRCRWRLA